MKGSCYLEKQKFLVTVRFSQKLLITPPWGLQWTGYCKELLHCINTEEDPILSPSQVIEL